ncbi:MAG: substrate-binding domain-containing protein [Lachnospiraceae bacterium]|nr:substrate-binding domain-containing protein [Lachnospiraceae bacterium]
MKKAIAMFMATAMAASMMVGCGNSAAGSTAASTETTTPEATATEAAKEDTSAAEGTTAASGAINVISREDGSGTRGAFIELFGIEEKDANGEKVDNTTEDAQITNNTSVMMTTVAGDTSAIGYISLGSLNDTVKALKIDGAEATAENIENGSYKISRPFNIVTKDDLSEVAKDFVDFIMSDDGQKVVTDEGYIAVKTTGAYAGSKPSGKIVVAGSSSVTPVMEKLAEAYQAVNTGATVEVQQSDSTTGVTSASDGLCDIGMASRELKDSESSLGLTATVIATDGIAVIVNKDSAVDELTSDAVKGIYTGTITDWADAAK